jgi:2-alkyl-3-oxoalkanoate reductase
VGLHLVPALVAAGHQVTATTRSAGKASGLSAAGATPVVVDGLDREGMIAAVAEARPDVIVHEMTALASMTSFRNFDREFATTNELRTRGTDYLLEAARQAQVRRVIAQSYAGWPSGRRAGGPVTTEADPLDPHPVPASSQSHAALRHVEEAVPAGVPEGLVLRYGSFYGPGASEALLDAVRKRRMPVIGDGAGVWSFIEVSDAAAATAAAVERGAPGVYNVVDDDPAPVSQWLPYLAATLGAKPPMRVPAWLGGLLAGEMVVSMMTQIQGASNEKAKRELGWKPAYPSWRDGFRAWAGGINSR